MRDEIFRAALVCVVSFTLVGCGGDPEPPTETSASSAPRETTPARTETADPEVSGENAEREMPGVASLDGTEGGEVYTPDASREPGPLRVVVSIPTLRWPIESLIGEEDELVSIVKPGESPHGKELTPEDVKLIDRADLLVTVGLGLDEEIARAARNRPSAHRTEVSLAEIARNAGQLDMYTAGGHDHGAGEPHDHGEGDSHDHSQGDPHIWLVPSIMQVYAEDMGAELEVAYSLIGQWDEQTMIRVGREYGNSADLAAITDRTLEARLGPFAGRGIVTNHSAFGRFLERFGLKEYATLQPHHGVEPTAGDIRRVVDAIREHDLRGIIAVPGFDMRAVRRVAETTGVQVVEFDPIGSGDWFHMMDEWYVALYTALTGAPPAPPE